jgi:hypothetical protein
MVLKIDPPQNRQESNTNICIKLIAGVCHVSTGSPTLFSGTQNVDRFYTAMPWI